MIERLKRDRYYLLIHMTYKKIVCGVTGSEPSQKAAQEAARLAKEHQAGLIYVYAVDIKFLKGMTIQLTSDFAEKTLEHLGGHILERAEESAAAQGVTPRKDYPVRRRPGSLEAGYCGGKGRLAGAGA